MPLLGLGVVACFQARQGLGLLLMDQRAQDRSRDHSTIHQDEHACLHRAGEHLDDWREQMSRYLTHDTLCELERECLTSFLQQISNLRPHLVQCYDREGFPRTNNEMERSIRALKTRYRRISGRKNWNAYLLRYGRSVAYYEWWTQDAARRQQLVERASRLDHARWHRMRRETTAAQYEQLIRFRFRHKRQAYLASLEDRWAAATST